MTLAEVTAFLLIFGPVTAFFLSCFVPTLLGASVTAAHESPPSAMNSARRAATIAAEGRRLRMLRIPSPVVACPRSAGAIDRGAAVSVLDSHPIIRDIP